ncbi:MAG: beta-N-acetylhexosaminidase [Armatimonadota bacterium]|nr:beta-N-acetylhexosaminidase [Armatimonadota bacterium]
MERASVVLPVALLILLLAVSVTAGPVTPDAFVPPAAGDVWPAPRQVRWGRGQLALTAGTPIVVGEEAAAEDLFAARELNEELQARFGLTLPVVRAFQARWPAPVIAIGEPWLNPASARLLLASGLVVTPDSPGPQGYVLHAGPRGVVVAGSDRRGTFYGVQTLRQLLRRSGDGIAVPAVTIRDWPAHRVRAVHILLDAASEEIHGALVDRILAPFKFTTIVAEAHHVQWDSGRPLWSPDPRGASKAQVRALLEAARQHHMDVIPLIATLGHSEWVFAGLRDPAVCRQIAYLPPPLEGSRPQLTCDRVRGVYPSVYDPRRPLTADASATIVEALVLPVLEEAVDLFRPVMLHIGHDEVRGPGGATMDLGLYLRDISALDAFLRQRGVRTMVWGDVLYERRAEAVALEAYRALPRDLVVVPWKYEDAAAYPEVEHFRREGFPVMGATWYRLRNTVEFSRAAYAAGALGMIRTTWTGQFQNRASLTRAYRQLYTYLTAANYFWNPFAPDPATVQDAELARRFADAWAPRPLPASIPGRPVDLSRAATRRHVDDDGTGWLGKGPEFDLRALAPGRQRLAGVLFDILDPRRGPSVVMLRGERDVAADLPARVTVPVGAPAACLAVLHATLDSAPFGEVVGAYTVHRVGAEPADIPLRYGREISSWLVDPERGVASIEQQVAWTGRTRAGVDVNLQVLWWRNPDPAKVVRAVTFASAGGRASPAVFALTALEGCP